jgi:hypothetical protein
MIFQALQLLDVRRLANQYGEQVASHQISLFDRSIFIGMAGLLFAGGSSNLLGNVLSNGTVLIKLKRAYLKENHAHIEEHHTRSEGEQAANEIGPNHLHGVKIRQIFLNVLRLSPTKVCNS